MAEKQKVIRESYSPEGEELENLQMVYQRKRDMGDARSKYEPLWDKWEKQWESYRPPRDADDWTSDIYSPLTASIIEAEMSEIVNQELKPWVVERGAEDAPKATIMNNILDYTWDISKSDVATYEIIHDALVFGTGIGQEYYLRQERTIRETDGKTRRVLEYDDCFLEPVKLQDFYVDEKARSFWGPYQAEDCIRRYVMKESAFKNFFQGNIWDPLGNAKFVKPGAGDVNYYEFFKPPQGLMKDEIEVLWYWNRVLDLLIIVANDVLLKMGPNPYKHKRLPFARAIDTRRNYQFYGKGTAETLESIQEETNTLRRMIIDRNHLDIDKPIMVSDTLTINDEDTVVRPHAMIPVGDVNGAKPLEYSDIPMSVFKSLELINDDKIRVTGMDERQQSISAAGTATEAAILKEATLKRINMKVWQIKNDFLVDVGTLRVSNIIQFYSQPKLEKIVGEKGTEEYQQKVGMAQMRGNLVSSGEENYVASYRNIRVKDKAISMNPRTGMVKEQPARGFTFFKADPEFFLPTHGGFDIKYKATSTMPISKPLKQQKDLEMYRELIQNPTMDPWKLGEMLLKSGDYDPEEFKLNPQGQGQQGGDEGQNLQKLIDLAGMENAEMMQGKEIGPTPYASPAHTEIHIEFMKSKNFQEDVPPEDQAIIQIFATHVQGELMAQQSRGGEMQGVPGADIEMGEGMMPQAGEQGPINSQNPEMSAAMPDRNQGGGEMPSGMQGSQAGVMVGRNA